MFNVSNPTRSYSSSKAPGEIRDTSVSFTGDNSFKELISKANSISLIKIFKHYHLNIDEINRKSICPFPNHKKGRESTASFYYYPETNSFWCFGCKIGITPSDFVAAKELITKVKAAYEIINIFNLKNIDTPEIETKDFSEVLEAMLEFSNLILEFRRNNSDTQSYEFIENICSVYDTLNIKHNLSSEALKSLTKQFKNKIDLSFASRKPPPLGGG